MGVLAVLLKYGFKYTEKLGQGGPDLDGNFGLNTLGLGKELSIIAVLWILE